MLVELYRVFHIFGLLLVIGSLGAAWGAAVTGTTPRSLKGKLGAVHGIGLLLLAATGFLRAQALGYLASGWPGWIIAKSLIWLFFGASLTIAHKRSSRLGFTLLTLWFVLGGVAAWLALFKPF